MVEYEIIKRRIVDICGKKIEFYYLEHSYLNRCKNILFVHGANHTAWCWNANFMNFFLKSGYNVYSINLYNRGNSSNTEKNLFIYYVDQLYNFIEHFNKDFILIGHSVGTAIVQKYISKYKSRIEKCVLMCPVAPWGMKYDLITMFHRDTIKKILLILYNNRIIKKYPLGLFVRIKLSCIENEYFIPEKFSECFFEFLKNYEINMDVPMIILGSKGDKVINYKTIYKMAALYNSKYIVYDDIGHDMMLDLGWENVAKNIIKYISDSSIRRKI